MGKVVYIKDYLKRKAIRDSFEPILSEEISDDESQSILDALQSFKSKPFLVEYNTPFYFLDPKDCDT